MMPISEIKKTLKETAQKLKDPVARQELKQQFKDALQNVKDKEKRQELIRQIEALVEFGAQQANEKLNEVKAKADPKLQQVRSRVEGVVGGTLHKAQKVLKRKA